MSRIRTQCASTMRWMVLCLLAALCARGGAQAASLMKTNGTVIAYSGMAVPGLPGVNFGGTSSFNVPVLAEDGSVLFNGRMTGTGVTATNERALFRGTTAATLSMMIRGAAPAPDLTGITLNTASASGIGTAYRMSPDGRTLWGSALSGTGVTTANDTALFGGYAGSLGLIAREGDPAPGTVGAVFGGSFSSPGTQNTGINRNGSVLFQATLLGGDVVGTTNNAAWYTGAPGSLAIMVRKGATVLGTGETASSLLFTSQMDNNGRALYDLTLGAPATTANDSSLWLYTPGSGSTLLVREGSSAPGTAGATFNNAANTWAAGVGPNAFTRTGFYTFLAELLNGDVTGTTNNQALYRGTVGSGPTMVARKGDPAPGTDAVFNGFNATGTSVNASGMVAFEATLTGGTSTASNNSGIWVGTPGSLQLIARQGSLAPGTVGALISGLLGQPMLSNDTGQIMFSTLVTGGDVGGGNQIVILGWDPINGLFLVARSAEQLEVAPGVFKSVTQLGSFSQFSNTDGAPLAFNHGGKFVIAAGFPSSEGGIVTVDLNCYPTTTYYRDADGDGFGNPSLTGQGCHGAGAPAGYVADNTDCNDGSAAVHPGAPDAACNGVDDNCSGTADEGYVPTPTACGTAPCDSTGQLVCLTGGVLSDTCSAHATDGVLCGDVGTQCTNQDACFNGACLDNGYQPSGAACGSPAGSDCDHPDTCDGAGVCQSNFEPSGTACGSPADTDCTQPDTCNGSGACLTHDFADGTACTSDDNTCTTDVCAGGACAHNVLPDGTACSDGGACTTGDTCAGGVCSGTVSCRNVLLPAAEACPGGDVVVPVGVDAATGVTAMAFDLTYDPAVVVPVAVTRTPYTEAFSLTSSLSTPGHVTLSMSSATPLSGAGEVAWIVFHAVGAAGASSALHWVQHDLNVGAIVATPFDGTVSVVSRAVTFSMPNASGTPGSDVTLPVHVDGAGGALAFDFKVRFLPGVIGSVTAATTPATAGWSLTTNLTTPGTAILSLFSTTPLSGSSADIATITFHVTGGDGDVTPLDVTVGNADETTSSCLNDALFIVCLDADNDGYLSCGGDCNDHDPSVHPGAADAACNGFDDDCDGSTDEDYAPAPTQCGTAPCDSTGQLVCLPGGVVSDTCNPAVTDGNACDDGSQCTTLDSCSNGICTGPPLNCDDANVCTTDSCLPASGCSHDAICTITGRIYYNKVTADEPNPGIDGPDLTKPVKGVTVDRAGTLTLSATTDTAGFYQFSNDAGGNVTLTPQDLVGEETECRSSITAADATRIARGSVQLVHLSSTERVAADVSANGTVTSFDAALVAQKAIAPTCTGYVLPVESLTGSAWAWVPGSRTYTPLTGAQDYDFTGVLYGDVTGNWVEQPPIASLGAPAMKGDPAAEGAVEDGAPPAPAVSAEAALRTGNGKAVLYMAQGPTRRADGLYEVVLGIQHADGILGLDMKMRYRRSDVAIRAITPTGIGASFTAASNDENGECTLSFFSAAPMEGTGPFAIVTIDLAPGAGAGLFQISAEANEGRIPLTVGFPAGRPRQ